MTCEEALRKLYEVIDKEASEIDRKEVEAHLEHCKSCMARYQFEAMFKTFVVEKAASPSKKELLKDKIVAQIDHFQENPGHSGKGESFLSNPFRYRSVLVAAAAALVICILAAFATSSFYRHRTFIYPFEKSHMAIHHMDVDNLPHNTEEIGHFISSDMHLAVNDNDNSGYRLIGCCFDEVQGHKFAHLRYNNGDTNVSLFVGSRDGVNLPDFDRKISADSMEYFTRDCRECQVAYWTMGDAVVIAVTENKNAELTKFIPAMAAI